MMASTFDVFHRAAMQTPAFAGLPQQGPNELPFVASFDEPGVLLSEEERPRCSAPECNVQPRFWKRSARPVFEGQWSCSSTCRETLVSDAVRRWADVAAEQNMSRTHRHRIPLGLLLLERDLVTQAQLRKALEAQRAAGHGRIGYWLQTECGVSATVVARGLAAQWNRPVLSAHGLVSATMAHVMPAPLRARFGLAPLRVAGKRFLYVGFNDGISPSVVQLLERMSGIRVETGVMTDEDFAVASSELDRRQAPVLHEKSVATIAEMRQCISQALMKEQPVASRLVAAHGSWWLRLWLERGAFGAHGFLPATGDDVVDYVFQLDAPSSSLMRESLDWGDGV